MPGSSRSSTKQVAAPRSGLCAPRGLSWAGGLGTPASFLADFLPTRPTPGSSLCRLLGEFRAFPSAPLSNAHLRSIDCQKAQTTGVLLTCRRDDDATSRRFSCCGCCCLVLDISQSVVVFRSARRACSHQGLRTETDRERGQRAGEICAKLCAAGRGRQSSREAVGLLAKEAAELAGKQGGRHARCQQNALGDQ